MPLRRSSLIRAGCHEGPWLKSRRQVSPLSSKIRLQAAVTEFTPVRDGKESTATLSVNSGAAPINPLWEIEEADRASATLLPGVGQSGIGPMVAETLM